MKKKHYSKEKANRKDEQILSRYQANPGNIEDKNIKKILNIEALERRVAPV